MRLNKWIASNSTYSRRKADELIASGQVTVNGTSADQGMQVTDEDEIKIGLKIVEPLNQEVVTIMLNKPAGVVCSRNGQGAPTVYAYLPMHYHHLDIVGRLDKDTSGLLLLTSDGQLHQQLTHPSYEKEKVYKVTLHKPLTETDESIIKQGVHLPDGDSKLQIDLLNKDRTIWKIKMHEGRNRQIRRTFEQIGYAIKALHRSEMGDYKLGPLETGKFLQIP